MMRCQIKQKLFAWGDDFVIRDADDEPAYFVDGKAFRLGKQLSFQDMSGHELAFIKQKLLAWGPTYEIYRDGKLIAVVKKELFTLLRGDREVAAVCRSNGLRLPTPTASMS